jgi:hypothetical protein
MEVSSSSNTHSLATAPGEIQKTAQTVQERDNLKIIESATEQSQQVTAQKTGVGNSINITG